MLLCCSDLLSHLLLIRNRIPECPPLQVSLRMQVEEYGGFPRDSAVKNPPASAGGTDVIPGSGRSLEDLLNTHSSIIALEIPWTEEPGGLQSMGLQRVGHDLVTKQ